MSAIQKQCKSLVYRAFQVGANLDMTQHPTSHNGLRSTIWMRTFISRTVVISFDMVAQVRSVLRFKSALSALTLPRVDPNHVPLHLGVELRGQRSSPLIVCKENGGGRQLRSTHYSFNNVDIESDLLSNVWTSLDMAQHHISNLNNAPATIWMGTLVSGAVVVSFNMVA